MASAKDNIILRELMDLHRVRGENSLELRHTIVTSYYVYKK